MNHGEFQQLVEEKRRRNPIWFALHADARAEPAVIEAAEARLGVNFPEEYRSFLRDYGGGYFAFSNVFSVDPESEWNIERRNAPLSPEIRAGFLAISDPATGDYYGFRVSDGIAASAIWVLDHDEQTIRPTSYGDLFEYLAAVGLTP